MPWRRILFSVVLGLLAPAAAVAEDAAPAGDAPGLAGGRLRLAYRPWTRADDVRFEANDPRWAPTTAEARGARVTYAVGDRSQVFMGYIKSRNRGFDPGRDWRDGRRRAYTIGVATHW